MITTQSTSTSKVVSQPFPFVGSSQHLVIVRDPKSRRPVNRALYLEYQDLPNTVLRSAFCEGSAVIPTLLPAPHNFLELPDLLRSDLREQVVVDGDGHRLGWLLQVPGLYVHANQILSNVQTGNTTYGYDFAIARMASEAARQLCSVLRRGVLRVREKPGLMAHAQEIAEIPADCMGISEGFAKRILKQVQAYLPEITDAWQLDGFPVYGIRFPLANQWGIQELTLKILPGQGQYIAINPWNLGVRYLGDSDGDLAFVLLRVKEVVEGALAIRNTPRIVPDRDIKQIRSKLSLQNIRQPHLIPDLNAKTRAKIDARFDTTELRLKAIEEADTRGMVAIFTMVTWWAARVLITAGEMGPRKAHQKAYDAMEWMAEEVFDCRKGGAAITGLNIYGFADTLLRGDEELPIEQLRQIGAPEKTIETLALAWALSGQNLRGECGKSPIYSTFVLDRTKMDQSAEGLLGIMKQMGVAPAEVYRTIVTDLTGASPWIPNDPEIPESSGDRAASSVTYGSQWAGCKR